MGEDNKIYIALSAVRNAIYALEMAKKLLEEEVEKEIVRTST